MASGGRARSQKRQGSAAGGEQEQGRGSVAVAALARSLPVG